MNELSPYEIFIARQLKELRASERKEAVWNKVMPYLSSCSSDVMDAAPVKPGSSFVNRLTHPVFIAVLVVIAFVLVLLIFLFLQSSNGSTIPTPQRPSTKSIPFSSPMQDRKAHKKELPFSSSHPSSIPTDDRTYKAPNIHTTTTGTSLVQGVIETSVLAKPIGLSKRIDTILKYPSLLPIKKGIGVSGINDSSYRIGLRKDSLK
jgi:cytoskeletal protein RodZ